MPKRGWKTVSLPEGLLDEVRMDIESGPLRSHTSISAFVEYSVRKELDRAREFQKNGTVETKSSPLARGRK